MTKLTTHCLDTFSGKPAIGVKVDVYSISGKRERLNSATLNNNGRTFPMGVIGFLFHERSMWKTKFLEIILGKYAIK